MTSALFYKQGSLEDLKQLKQLAIKSYGQYASVLSPENWETLNRFLHDEKSLSELIIKSTPFICLDNAIAVGMAYLVPRGNPTDIYQDDWSYIRMVGVDPAYSGQGIARRLTKMCIKKAKESGEKTVALHTSEFMKAARHIYESMGFTVLREIPPRFGKKYWLYKLDIS